MEREDGRREYNAIKNHYHQVIMKKPKKWFSLGSRTSTLEGRIKKRIMRMREQTSKMDTVGQRHM